MKQLDLIKKVGLILILFIFLIIELLSLKITNLAGKDFAFVLQVVACLCTGYLIYLNTKEFNLVLVSESTYWTKIRMLLAIFVCGGVLIEIYIFGVLSMTPPTAFQSLGVSGFILGIMYGKNWRHRLLNGFVLMQGFSAIEWATISIKNVLTYSGASLK